MPLTVNGAQLALPPSFVGALVNDSIKESPIASLATATPIPLNGGVVPFYNGGVEAGEVGETGEKPVVDGKYAMGKITPVKFACITLHSEELARLNPNQMLDAMREDQVAALGRAITLAVTQGKSTLTGENLTTQVSFLNQTTNRTSIKGDLTPKALQDAYVKAYSGSNYSNPDGVLIDARYGAQVASIVQTTPLGVANPNMNLRATTTQVMGLNAAFARGVDGRLGNSTGPRKDTAIDTPTGNPVAFVGDFKSGMRFGYGMDATMRVSTEGAVKVNGEMVSLFQTNQIAVLTEVVAGWFINPALFSAIDAE